MKKYQLITILFMYACLAGLWVFVYLDHEDRNKANIEIQKQIEDDTSNVSVVEIGPGLSFSSSELIATGGSPKPVKKNKPESTVNTGNASGTIKRVDTLSNGYLRYKPKNDSITVLNATGYVGSSPDYYRVIIGSSMSIKSGNKEIESTTDTTVLNSGDQNTIHIHEWAYKKQLLSTVSCTVYHGDLGCPNNWPVSFRICSICLRHEEISTTYRYVDKVDKYEETLKMIKD